MCLYTPVIDYGVLISGSALHVGGHKTVPLQAQSTLRVSALVLTECPTLAQV